MGKIISKNKVNTIDNNIVDIDTCAICLNNVKKTNKNIKMLECNHYYHTNCIDVWLSEKNVCPLCMQVTTYKPINEPKLQKETVINIIHNNVHNNVHNNARNKVNMFNDFFEYICCCCCNILKFNECIFISLTMFVLIANIVNIVLLSVVVSNINKNYISDINTNTNNTECFKNNQTGNYVSIIPDYFVQSVYTIYLFILPGLWCIKNKIIYLILLFVTFIISYPLNIYRVISLTKYLDIMEQINYCDNVNKGIFVEKIFLLSMIIILGITLPLNIIVNIKEYFQRINNNN